MSKTVITTIASTVTAYANVAIQVPEDATAEEVTAHVKAALAERGPDLKFEVDLAGAADARVAWCDHIGACKLLQTKRLDTLLIDERERLMYAGDAAAAKRTHGKLEVVRA